MNGSYLSTRADAIFPDIMDTYNLTIIAGSHIPDRPSSGGPQACPRTFFQCKHGNRRCIFKRYVCDGFSDCPDLSDESYERCGRNPCFGKIPCGDRCIVRSACCNPRYDHSCIAPPRCCLQLNSQGERPYVDYGSGSGENRNHHSGTNPAWGYQSAIFVIAGCSLATLSLVLMASYIATKYLMRKVVRGRGRRHGRRGCRSGGGQRQRQQQDDANDECHHHHNHCHPCSRHCEQSSLVMQQPPQSLLVHYTANNCSNEPEARLICAMPPPYSTIPRQPTGSHSQGYPNCTSTDPLSQTNISSTNNGQETGDMDLEPPSLSVNAPPPYSAKDPLPKAVHNDDDG